MRLDQARKSPLFGANIIVCSGITLTAFDPPSYCLPYRPGFLRMSGLPEPYPTCPKATAVYNVVSSHDVIMSGLWAIPCDVLGLGRTNLSPTTFGSLAFCLVSCLLHFSSSQQPQSSRSTTGGRSAPVMGHDLLGSWGIPARGLSPLRNGLYSCFH